ncbi:MAG: glycerophosphodiester phosphodiesterase [Alphaproteobacteria bacterium]
MRLPEVIGHRGAAGRAPENTLAGIRRAAALGVSWVEFDVKLTADGRCVLFHDETLDRTTDGSGRVAVMPYDAIRRLDAGGWFAAEFAGEPVPRLDAALALVVELGLQANIEIKPCPGRETETADKVVAEALACWPAARQPPLISSFTPECLAVARTIAPDWPRGLLCLKLPRNWRTQLAALDCCMLGYLHRRLNRRIVSRITAAGVAVTAFTVNDPAQATVLYGWGVTTIVSDVPDDLLAAP